MHFIKIFLYPFVTVLVFVNESTTVDLLRTSVQYTCSIINEWIKLLLLTI